MRRSTDRILTTHTGSLPRPADLTVMLETLDTDGTLDAAAFEARVRRAVTDAVRQQIDAGIDIVNDGEYGKSSWANYVLDRMTGFEPRPDTLYEAVWLGRDRFRFQDFMKAEFPRGAIGAPGHACIGSISYRGHESIRRNIEHL
jgi:5-methyltetrahydropteroyltriglutamate--homocysteine methyltransferase